MPNAKTASPPRGARRIAIAGHFLDDVRTRLHTNESANSQSYVSAPVARHHISEDEKGVTLKLPALTALQLYHDGVLSADPAKPVDLAIDGRKIGIFYLQWLRSLPDHEYDTSVLLRFERQPP